MHCDNALGRLEELLSTFRAQLGGLSSDILQLQHQSGQLGLRLANRQGARSLTGQIIDDLVVPESLIRFVGSSFLCFVGRNSFSRSETFSKLR